MPKPSKRRGKSPQKLKQVNAKSDKTKEKIYSTKEIETSITLLASPEENVVLDALLYISKYADLQQNNINYLYDHGILPRLMLLFDKNICIQRVFLRLLSKILATVDASLFEITEQKYDEYVLKILKFSLEHKDLLIKKFADATLAKYAAMGRLDIFVQESTLLPSLLKLIKEFDDAMFMMNSLELLFRLLDMQSVRNDLPRVADFDPDILFWKMDNSDDACNLILSILEKMTYYGDLELLEVLKKYFIIERMIEVILDETKKDFHNKAFEVFLHCIKRPITKSYFVETLHFLKFGNWVRSCKEKYLPVCSEIFLELSKVDEIRQMLFDLSVEESILSFLRSENKSVLNATCEAISNMSVHRFCCKAMCTRIVIKGLLKILKRKGDIMDPQNEAALKCLHDLAKRDSRAIHMISEYGGWPILQSYLEQSTVKLAIISYVRILEIANMFVANSLLKKDLMNEAFFAIVMNLLQSDSDEIFTRALEIGINSLNAKEFRTFFTLKKGPAMMIDYLRNSTDEHAIRTIAVFIHNSFPFDKLFKTFILKKLLLVVNDMSETVKTKIPLLLKIVKLIYEKCHAIKFFETGRLELTDVLMERFYIIKGLWLGPFPFLDVLELHRMSIKPTIYIVTVFSKCEDADCDSHCVLISQELSMVKDIDEEKSRRSTSTLDLQSSLTSSINYGRISTDPCLNKCYIISKKLVKRTDTMKKKIKVLAKLVDRQLCGPTDDCEDPNKMHNFNLHIECLKGRLGTNMIPIGYLRIGFHCERALLFKALADHAHIPATLVKGKNNLYWNEVALLDESKSDKKIVRIYVVDLMEHIGNLLPLGSRDCNVYCNSK